MVYDVSYVYPDYCLFPVYLALFPAPECITDIVSVKGTAYIKLRVYNLYVDLTFFLRLKTIYLSPIMVGLLHIFH